MLLAPAIVERYSASIAPEIREKLSSALRADVTIGRIAGKFLPPPSLAINDIKAVQEETEGLVIEAEEIRLGIDFYRLFRE